jgi:hypothetical protein
MKLMQQQQFLQAHALQQFQFTHNFPTTSGPQFAQGASQVFDIQRLN